MRILLGFILALSVSFACDQPYEEVSGYKIGCPFVETKEYINKAVVIGFDVKSYVREIDGIFDTIDIVAIDGNIEVIQFAKNDGSAISLEDIDSMLSALNKRWGNYSEKDKILPHLYTWYIDNKVIDKIFFKSSTPSNDNYYSHFSVAYFSKKALKLNEEFRQAMEKQGIKGYYLY